MTDEPRPEGQEAPAQQAATETATATAEAQPEVQPGQPLVVPDSPTGAKLKQTVDIRDAPEPPFVMEPEVRKLKYLLESLI